MRRNLSVATYVAPYSATTHKLPNPRHGAEAPLGWARSQTRRLRCQCCNLVLCEPAVLCLRPGHELDVVARIEISLARLSGLRHRVQSPYIFLSAAKTDSMMLRWWYSESNVSLSSMYKSTIPRHVWLPLALRTVGLDARHHAHGRYHVAHFPCQVCRIQTRRDARQKTKGAPAWHRAHGCRRGSCRLTVCLACRTACCRLHCIG